MVEIEFDWKALEEDEQWLAENVNLVKDTRYNFKVDMSKFESKTESEHRIYVFEENEDEDLSQTKQYMDKSIILKNNEKSFERKPDNSSAEQIFATEYMFSIKTEEPFYSEIFIGTKSFTTSNKYLVVTFTAAKSGNNLKIVVQ